MKKPFALLFAFPLLALAQTPLTSLPMLYMRDLKYRQLSASQLTDVRHTFIAVSFLNISGINAQFQFTAPTGTRYTLAGGGLSIPPIVHATDLAYRKEFPDLDSLNREFPNGTYSASVSALSLADTTRVDFPAGAPSLRITNYDSLQSWGGDTLDVQWAPLGNTASGLDFITLELLRPDGAVLYNSDRAPARIPSDSTSLQVDGLTITPGDILRASLTVTRLTGSPNAGSEILLNIVYRVSIDFTIVRAVAPTISQHPTARNGAAGDSISLSVAAAGSNPTYQWHKDGAPIANATSSTFTLLAAQPVDSGSYTVVVANAGGSVTSDAAVVTIAPLITAPTISAAPAALTVMAGEKVTLTVNASGSAPLTYQWLRNSVPIAGATQATFTIDRARRSDAAQYSVTVTNSAGATTSSAAEVKITPVSRISNLSIFTALSSAGDSFALGFVVSGGPAEKPVVIRAAGPSLASLGVQGVLDDPKLELFAGSVLTTGNDNWGGGPELTDAFKSVGAFAFASADSRDAAVATRVNSRGNSINVSGNGSGIVLAELYDATPADEFEIASSRFANVSVLKHIGTGLGAGFVIDGEIPLRVLLRAVGPTLGGLGVGGALADPKLELFASGASTAISTNDNWGASSNASEIAAASASVGAFALALESRDAVLLVTLPPGSYTAQVSGVNNTSGSALVEVYEVP